MSKLSNLLEDMITLARAHAGVPMKRHLQNGLSLQVEAPLSTEIRLTISREDTYPSQEEWRTIMRHFPYPVEETQPASEQQGSRYVLSARLPLQRSALAKL